MKAPSLAAWLDARTCSTLAELAPDSAAPSCTAPRRDSISTSGRNSGSSVSRAGRTAGRRTSCLKSSSSMWPACLPSTRRATPASLPASAAASTARRLIDLVHRGAQPAPSRHPAEGYERKGTRGAPVPPRHHVPHPSRLRVQLLNLLSLGGGEAGECICVRVREGGRGREPSHARLSGARGSPP